MVGRAALLIFLTCCAGSVAASALFALPPVLRSQEFLHPLEGPIHISGSFGEYRKFGRYHHGLDYKTFNRNGWTVRTPLPGVVERVHVSPRGYGNGLFLRSPTGVRTTYGHLHDFRCPGARPGPAQDLEYLRRSLELLSYRRGIFLKIPPWFRFAAGECIARSGESGSGAPHLHFEVEYGGRFVDPLALTGLDIPDTTAPIMLAIYVEDSRGIQRLPVVPIPEAAVPGGAANANDRALRDDSSAIAPMERYFELAPAARLERPLAPGRVRFLVGGYDTMAARNRNGVYSLELRTGARVVFRRDLSLIARGDLARSGRVYHTGRTVIGREYVYFLYENRGAKGGRSFTHAANADLDVRLRDASGNTAIFRGRLPEFQSESELTTQANAKPAAFQSVGPGGAAGIRRQTAGGELKARFGARSLHGPGLAALSVAGELSPAAASEVRQPGSDADAIYEQHGALFELRGRDLFYRTGARIDASFTVPDAHAEEVALYYFNETIDRWLLMAYPYRRANGRAYYRFTFRFEGVLAQLRDLSPPRIMQPSLWAPPTLFSESKREIVREYLIVDRGSGFSKRATRVLIDGRPLTSFAWIRDRAVLQLRLPADFPGEHGSVIAIKAGDHAGNFSGWFFDLLEPRYR